jgi:hypothetical protein
VCVFSSGEYENGGAGGLRGCVVGASESHTFVVVFRVSSVSAVPCVGCVTTTDEKTMSCW